MFVEVNGRLNSDNGKKQNHTNFEIGPGCSDRIDFTHFDGEGIFKVESRVLLGGFPKLARN